MDVNNFNFMCKWYLVQNVLLKHSDTSKKGETEISRAVHWEKKK